MSERVLGFSPDLTVGQLFDGLYGRANEIVMDLAERSTAGRLASGKRHDASVPGTDLEVICGASLSADNTVTDHFYVYVSPDKLRHPDVGSLLEVSETGQMGEAQVHWEPAYLLSRRTPVEKKPESVLGVEHGKKNAANTHYKLIKPADDLVTCRIEPPDPELVSSSAHHADTMISELDKRSAWRIRAIDNMIRLSITRVELIRDGKPYEKVLDTGKPRYPRRFSLRRFLARSAS